MIGVHDTCDHSHWAHYWLQHLCPLKYPSGTTVTAPSVPCNDQAVRLVCNAAPGPGAGPITSLAHWTIWAGISRVTPAQPRRSNEKRNQVPSAILIRTLGTNRLGVLYQEPGAYLEAGVPALLWSLHNSVGPLQDQVAQLQCRALEKSGSKGTERNERD